MAYSSGNCSSQGGCGGSSSNCVDAFGCPQGVSPDFVIKRHDTKPPLEIIVKDCGNPIDLTDTVVEVSMWAKGKLKCSIAEADTYFALADNIGFNQARTGDIIVIDRVRSPEQMLITGFDEANYLIQVQRGYNGTPVSSYKKGQSLKIFRFLNSVGETEMTYQDIEQTDGTVDEDVLTESKLVYEWSPNDTCLPGCYCLEFRLLKMVAMGTAGTAGSWEGFALLAPSVVPSFSSYTSANLGCELGSGVEWERRFPVEGECFLIKINNSPTSEALT